MDTGTGSLTHNSILLRLLRFVEEMGRRRVWRTALAYAAVVFVLLQLGEIVLPAFHAPDWALKVLVVTSLLGFPVVLCLAWVFDITSRGIQVTDASERAPDSPSSGALPGLGPQRLGLQRLGLQRLGLQRLGLPRLALLAVTLSLVGGLGWRTVRDTIFNPPQGTTPASQGSLLAAGLEEEAMTVSSLAVLPLDDFSEGEGGAYFTAGLHEELVSQISRLTSARVVSRTSVVQYDRSGKAMPAVAQELGVDGVVEGSVFRSGNRVRITVQLIHGPSDTHLWAESYEGTTDDAIALQREVAQAIARAIQAELFGDGSGPGSPTRVASKPRAQDEYMKGRYEQAKGTPEGLSSAVHHYQSAVEEDSSFAAAYAGLASAQILMEVQSEDFHSPEGLMDGEILHSLGRALQLDRESPEAQAVYLTLREAVGGDFSLEFPQGVAIILDSTAILNYEVAEEATEFGRQLNRVVIETNRIREVTQDPTKRIAGARRLASASHFDEAEASLQRVVDERPETAEAWDALEQIRAMQGDFEGAVRVRRERLSRLPEDSLELASLQDLQRKLSSEGSEGYWSWRLAELNAGLEGGEEVSPVELARALVGVGRPDDALPYLEQALEDRDRNLLMLWTDPGWDVLRNDPRFRGILRELRSLGGTRGFPKPGWPSP
jgi:TolB-like protein